MRTTIYQLHENANRYLTFASLDMVKRMGLKVKHENYKVVYDGDLDAEDPEDVYVALQGRKPEGYRGHSLSVSDVIEFGGRFFYCDSYGFVELLDFEPAV